MEGTSTAPDKAENAPQAVDWLRVALKLLRVKQWTKNLIVFAPILFAAKMNEPILLLKVAVCFVAFCLASSSIYILNDVLDRESDRAHPTKRNRPIASGMISPQLALSFSALFGLSSIALVYAVRPSLGLVVLAYVALMICYSAWLKHIVLVDAFCISAGFVLRAIAGAAAAMVPVSGWFLLCTSFGALWLALEKRRQELALLKSDAEAHRKTLFEYSEEMINRMESVILPSLLTCYAFYSFQSWHGQSMLLTVPFVVYGIMRYQVLSIKTSSTGTPEDVLLKDRPIQIAILLWLLTSAAVVYDLIPAAAKFIIQNVDSYAVFK